MVLALIFSAPGCTVEVNKAVSDPNPASDSVSVAGRGITAGDFAPGSWGIYWYLCGSDLESKYGCATMDLQEMIEVTLPENVTAVIQTGGAAQWQNKVVDHGALERYVYTGNELVRTESLPLASMGDPNTLADFLYYCNENYPAEKQAVILWDHGGGSLIGMELDELHDYDNLTLPGFRAAMEAVPAVSGAYELVGLDACLMATVDMVEILNGKAHYYVASEESEPGLGWDYTGLFSTLAQDPSIDGAGLGRAICDSYYSACDQYGMAGEVTLSVIDLSRADALLAAYEAVGDEALLLAVTEKQPYFSEFGRAAFDSETYGDGQFEMVDLGDLVKNAGNLLPQNGKALLDALNDCVVYQVKGPYRASASGLSCYYNFSGSPLSTELFRVLETNKPFGYYHDYAISGELSDEAQDYIKGLAENTGEPGPVIGPLPSTEEMNLNGFPVSMGESGHWQLELGPELSSNLAAVFVKLMYVNPTNEGGEGFRAVFGTGHDLTADFENGVFIEEFADTWGSIDGINVYMEPVGAGPGYVLYAVPVLLNAEEHVLHVGYTYGSGSEGKYEILGAWKAGDEKTGAASKTLKKLKPGDMLEPLFPIMLQNDNGEWFIDEPPMPLGSVTVNEDTSFYARTVGNGYFALFFEMIDYAGNSYLSSQASFRVREGRIERLPDGIKPATDATLPPGSIMGHYVQQRSFYHDGREEELFYYTVIVPADDYIEMANALGIPNGAAGDQTEGDGYTIMIYSDTFDLAPYAGMTQVYFTGTYFEGDTIYHRRDIVFRVESITEVW